MTQPQVEPQVPDWSLGWRLRRALEWGDVAAKEMATELDVSEGTISRWCHDVGAPPRTIYLRAWAERCRVPLDWLIDGDEGGAPALGLEPKPAGSTKDHEQRLMSRVEILAMRKRLPIRRPDREESRL